MNFSPPEQLGVPDHRFCYRVYAQPLLCDQTLIQWLAPRGWDVSSCNSLTCSLDHCRKRTILIFFIVPYTKILVLPRFVSSMSQEKILTQLPLSRYSTLKIQGGCLIIFFIRNIFIKNFGAEVMTLALIHCRGNICSFIFFPVTKSMFCYILLPFF